MYEVMVFQADLSCRRGARFQGLPVGPDATLAMRHNTKIGAPALRHLALTCAAIEAAGFRADGGTWITVVDIDSIDECLITEGILAMSSHRGE